jgi:hypothetical protein
VVLKGGLMAEKDDTESGMDYAEHQKSYDTFLFLTKWSVIVIAVLLILMTIFLV